MSSLRLPALATAHSHAFQRGIRGLAQRARGAGREDFWSWRAAMYQAACDLTPESFERVTRVAYRELRRVGVRTVGEFHYVHHQADGTPYAERTLLADIAIRVAKEEGLRIALLRAAYHRGGPDLEASSAQLRFSDPSVDHVLRDVDALRLRYADDADVRIGLAPHSTRAIPPSWLRPLADYARQHAMPCHMHVAEQQREVDESLAETGKRPLELLVDSGMVDARFVAVHATNLAEHEARLLGEATGFACLCPTTERDLGDGLADIAALRRHGVRLCTGIDSHVLTDPLEDLRALETHERLRLRKRVTAEALQPTLAAALWHEGSVQGAQALGFADAGGWLSIPHDAPELELCGEESRLDAIVFGATTRLLASSTLHPEP